MSVKPSVSLEQTQYSLIDVFSADARPTLLIDVSTTIKTRGVHLHFANDAFTGQYGVLLRFIISGQILEPEFIEWLKSPSPSTNTYVLGDLSWNFFILKQRWKVVNVAATTVGKTFSEHAMSEQGRPLTETGNTDGKSVSAVQETQTIDSDQAMRRGLTVALPSGLVSLGSAPTALDGLHRSVDLLDVGFFEYNVNGTLIFANKSWYTQSGHPTTPLSHTEMRFLDLCHPDDAGNITNAWIGLMEGKPITFEMRWKHATTASGLLLGAQWVLAACVPLYDGQGHIASIVGCTTDINNQKLNEQNALSRAEALERARTSEERFTRFASVAPIVVFNLDAEKRMTYCNDRWFEVTATHKKAFGNVNVREGFLEGDILRLFKAIDEATQTQEVNSIEMRTKKAWRASDGRWAQAWVSASIFAEFTNEGVLQGCTGTLTDISEFKYAETLQRIRLEEALEAKRQQENFIDMTSHEMRNPLSAIVQCADSALAAVTKIGSLVGQPAAGNPQAPTTAQLLEEVEVCVDGLQIIVSCCAHQKRIIDDVLTLSKMDANLLAVTPVEVEPKQLMQDVIKMFEIDAQKADVRLSMKVDDSIRQFNIEWLMLDPSRIKQILINLISNSIKFTRTESTREVILSMSASLDMPTSSDSFQYAPASQSVDDGFLTEKYWGSGQVIYLKFSVHDTGRGLRFSEQEKLFHRFSQASPKTHVEYGGSGLGLFITKRLTELHGGEIGVASRRMGGSTFGFYIRARQTTRALSQPAINAPLSFPVRLSDTDRAPSKLAVLGRTGSTTSPQLVKSHRSHNVLVVEDNMVNQKVLSTQLKRLGYTVFVAGHGVEALDFLRTTNLWHGKPDTAGSGDGKTVDVILMDIEMPIMGGLACTRAIRDLEEQGLIRNSRKDTHNSHGLQHRRLPIISISANARVEQGDQQREAGVDDILTKPFRIVQLVEKIQRLLPESLQASTSP